MADQLVNGARLRVLTIVDVFTLEALATEVGQRLRACENERLLSSANDRKK